MLKKLQKPILILLFLATLTILGVFFTSQNKPTSYTHTTASQLRVQVEAENTLTAARVAAESTRLAADAAAYATSVSSQKNQSTPNTTTSMSTEVIVAIIGAISVMIAALIAAYAQVRVSQAKVSKPAGKRKGQ